MACKLNRFTAVMLVNNFYRFRWVFCQLENLRHCLPPSVRHTLDELPESLDETYERVLKEIKKPNRNHARRLLQCLVAAVRPLRVEELAEVLAIDFDDVEGIPKLNPNWRWEDEEQALLTSCSSLIVIIETEDSRVVQFSHFSVKEFMTSTRLASSIQDISRFHIDLEPAHTILAQACMGILLRTDDLVEDNGTGRNSSLARYAAEHWVKHAQFERVSSFLRKAMENLFDLNKPFFTAWLQIYNVDIPRLGSSSLFYFAGLPAPSATPLYYAALCGFQDLVEHLAVKHPLHVNARGGRYVTPVVAALAGRHFQTAKFLHDNGAHLDVRSQGGETLLHSPAFHGDVEMVEILLGYNVDVNARREGGLTPLHEATIDGARNTRINDVFQSSPDVVRILLEHGADVNTRSDTGMTALHFAQSGEVVRVLLKHGANLTEDEERKTPLHYAVQYRSVKPVRLLLEHGADPNARSNDGSIPLHLVAVNLSSQSFNEFYEVVCVLLEYGSDVAAKDDEGRTPLYRAAENMGVDVESVRLLLEHGADLNTRTNNNSTLLHAAAANWMDEVQVLRALLERGMDIDTKDDEGRTPLHGAARSGNVEIVRFLLEHGADPNARSYDSSIPLHLTAGNKGVGYLPPGKLYKVVRVLLEYGADVAAKDDEGRTPLYGAARNWNVDIESVRMLLEHGADLNARTNNNSTPLHAAAANETERILRTLLERGANVSARDSKGRTPLHIAAENPNVELVRVLLERGANVGAKDDEGQTPLHKAAENGWDEVVRVLLKRGANAGAKDFEGRTPLQLASVMERKTTVELLLEYGHMIPTSTSSLCLPW